MKAVNRTTDFLMVLLMPILMAYSLIGEAFHEAAGTVMLTLFLLHHTLHSTWRKGVMKGKYTPYRICQIALNAVLAVLMLLQPFSGIAVSKHLYAFLPLTGIAARARGVHLAAAYWCYTLMSFHLGLHADMAVCGLNRRIKAGTLLTRICRIAVWLAALYGVFAFVQRGLPGYMFMRTLFAYFDYGEPRIFFFADYLAIMTLFAVGGYYTGKILNRKQRKEK